MQYNLIYSKFWPYYYKIRRRQKKLETLLHRMQGAETLSQRLELANEAASMAWYVSTGYHSLAAVENVYLECANTLPSVTCAPVKHSILHVMTRCYCSGGHTRVVERWINHSDVSEKHSVILLSQGEEPIPQWLEDAVKKHSGDFIVLNEPNQMQRAYQLRQIAANYEHIVLHVHMDDGTPIIAFGVENFTNPVILFNHADHVCWVGISIADVVTDIRYNTKSTEYRRANKAMFLGIPSAANMEMNEISAVEKHTCRNQLGISDKEFVVISTADNMKYRPIGQYDYVRALLPIVKKYDVHILSIGGNPDELYWQQAYRESQGRIEALGTISNKDTYSSYLKAADLYVSSFPFASFTAMMDAAQIGLPCLQLQVLHQHNTTWAIDECENQSIMWSNSIRTMRKQIIRFMKDDVYKVKLLQETQRWLHSYANISDWKTRLQRLYTECPSIHHVHSFDNKKGRDIIINDECVMNNHIYKSIIY